MRVIQQYSIIFLALGLLILAASRLIALNGLELNTDEVWSIWQSFGTPEQIIRWTPYDWPPLYYLILGGWKIFVGPVTLRRGDVVGNGSATVIAQHHVLGVVWINP